MKTAYAAIPGGVLSAEKANVAGRELKRIEKKFGAIKPAVVVKESRPTKAPLHACFTWDDNVAADQWREEQARQIIRSVRVIIHPELPHAEQPVIRCFVSVKASERERAFSGQAYIATERAFSNDAYREQVLASAKAEILMWQRKYTDLLTFAGATDALDTLVAGLSG